MRALTAMSATALTIFIAAGCTSSGYIEMPSLQALSRQTAEDQPQTFTVVGSVAVDVESFAGSVTIVADDEAKVATVQVTRDARHGFMRTDEAEASLAQIEYTAELVNTETGQLLHVKTWTSHDQPYQQRAHVRITAPSITDVYVRTRNGTVLAENAQGTVDIDSSGGDVRVMTDQPMTKSVTIVNKDGDIDYRIVSGSTARFDCQTVRGRVLQRVRHGSLIVQSPTDDNTLLATLNGGANPVTLRTVDGNIRIAVVPDPTRVGAMIVEP